MKAETISYAATQEDWRPYFDNFTDRTRREYVLREKEDEEDEKGLLVAYAVAAGVLLLPLGLLASLTL